MQGHYGSLAADTTGHSLDLQYWHDSQPIQVFRDTPTIRTVTFSTKIFSWNQIAAALLQMSPRKAPGNDGITTAFYQAALYMLPTPKKVLHQPICSRSVESAPMRIERLSRPTNLLSYEQAGFRKREECVGQVVSLVDIIQRRQNAGLKPMFYSLISERNLIQFQLVHFPGLSRDTNPVRGLMYADDVTVFADSEQSMLAALTAV
ncbi:hypothetical protein BASA81_014081 [Batrachochytrium salamandrivorans]|nr:hypothetical protein BASA81_014081 [Batrachochytrium salamandrivorans]